MTGQERAYLGSSFLETAKYLPTQKKKIIPIISSIPSTSISHISSYLIQSERWEVAIASVYHKMTGSILRSVMLLLLLAPLSISWAFCTPIAQHKRSASTAVIPPVVSRCSSAGGSSSSSSLYSLAPLMDEISEMVRDNDQVKSTSSG